MKDLIRKILHESIQISHETPDWVEKFGDLSDEERIQFIKDYKKHVERILPTIVKYFKYKLGDELVKIEIGEHGVHYGNENFSIQVPTIKFYFDFSNLNRDNNWSQLAKREIYQDLRLFFNIDITYYGTPLNFEIYKMTWERV